MRRNEIAESVQKIVARLIATHPAGEGLRLVGGFRYRLLDSSCRRSVDMDYHWIGDLDQKQRDIHALLQKQLRPEVRRQLGYDSDVRLATGPDAESAFVKTVEVAVFKTDSPHGRIEIPVDITRIPCLDRPIIRTVDGVVYSSVSDTDMVESKVIALFTRSFIAERDLLDLFLFQDKFVPDSATRLRRKLADLSVAPTRAGTIVDRMKNNRIVHIRAIRQILHDQVDGPAAAHVNQAGGPGVVFDHVVAHLETLLEP